MAGHSFILIAFSTLFTIVNPIGILPVFVAVTGDASTSKKKKIALKVGITSTLILLSCSIFGSVIFEIFGISLAAFKIAGGILLFMVALEMLNAKHSRSKSTPEEHQEGAAKEDMAIFPLSIPLVAGPGAIASVFMLTDKATTLYEHGILYVVILVTMLVLFVSLRSANEIQKFLGTIGINVLTRLMGLILAAMAVQFVIDGFLEASK